MSAKLGIAIFATFLIGGGNVPVPARTTETPNYTIARIPGGFSVLTYNVQGLPWPIESGRPAALGQIGDKLAAMRARGMAPNIVVLQEAFTPEAEAIGKRAGYRHQVFGPQAADPRPALPHPAAPAYLAQRSIFNGEVAKPWLSSGLVILSDFPVTGVRRTAFPTEACAGTDCLANKGIVAARIAVPGAPAPVEVVGIHLNSRTAAARPEPVSRYAWGQQLEALDNFIGDESKMKPTIRLLVGDFNVGHSPQRLSLLFGYIRHWRMKSATAMGKGHKYGAGCADHPEDCITGLDIKSNVPLVHANDWQLYFSPGDEGVKPVARDVLFGRGDNEAKALSDHVGFSVNYRFQ